MAVSAQRIPTFEELYEAIRALPEGITGEILSDGIIETMGRPGKPHRAATDGIRDRIRGSSGFPGGRWAIETEAEVRLLHDRLVVPDLSGWRLADAADDAFLYENPIRRVPDWACEILSAPTERKDRDEKLPLYARGGVGHVWIVDPDARFVEVYASREGAPTRVAVARDTERVRLPPFDLELDLSTWWVPARR